MKQYEQVIDVMKNNGGFATLGFLNQNVNVSKWKTKTPFASIRRIVQDEKYFYKIKPGLWALLESKESVLKKFQILERDIEKQKVFNHSYFQGLLLEIGRMKGYNTYLPPQDKNKLYLDKPLKLFSDVDKIYNFCYSELLRRAKTVDVIWFNRRKMPHSFFEVEHSTDIQNSLLKFNDLQDFYSNFYIVGNVKRKNEFKKKINYSAFTEISDRVYFIDYEFISNLHSKTYALNILGDL